MSQPQTQKNKFGMAQFWTVWILLTIVTLGAGGFWGWKYLSLEKENLRFETSIENTGKRLDELSPSTTNLTRKRTEIAKRAETQRVKWSEVMTDVLKLETKSARFINLRIEEDEISTVVMAANWDSLEGLVDKLWKTEGVREVRIQSTEKISQENNSATQTAKLSFKFNPPTK